jgi:hypothetical protein
MTEIALIWDRPILFEKLFVEYGFAFERVSPLQIGGPYAPKFKVAVLPVGFGNPVYSTVAKSVKNLGTPLRHFVEEGGVLIAFSPYVDAYDFAWLKLSCTFRLLAHDRPLNIQVKRQHPAAHILDVLEAQTDGYFAGIREDNVILQSEDGAVLIVMIAGDGQIVLSAIHEFPARRFIAWAVEAARI